MRIERENRPSGGHYDARFHRLVELVTVVPAETGFVIELVGKIANMARPSEGAESLAKEPYRSSAKVVAGGLPALFAAIYRRYPSGFVRLVAGLAAN